MSAKRRVIRNLSVAALLSVASLSLASLAFSGSDSRLADAAQKQDKATVRSLLKQHAEVNSAQADGATALAWAAHWDDLETADLLIRAGANLNAANEYGVTPLSLACTNGSPAMVEKLLNAGADANAARKTGETPLMTAASAGNLEVVKLLLAHGADINAKEQRRGQTALMWAVAEQHPAIAAALIEHRADVHARSNSGFTPLLFAAQQGDLVSAGTLLATGADVNESTPAYGNSLVVAAASGHEKLALFLLEKGADPNSADAFGATALHYAVLKGITTINRTDILYSTAHLFRPDMMELTKALLAHAANPNAGLLKNPGRGRPQVSVVGATPFWLAAVSGNASLMRVLVASGANPKLATKDNTTPLMVAAGVGLSEDRAQTLSEDRHSAEEEKNALEAVKLAAELGGDVNAANGDGLTPLHGAARTGEDSIVQFLVEKGAMLDPKDKYGQTPLSIALAIIPATMLDFTLKPFGAHPSTADLLLKLGATPLATTAPDGGTPVGRILSLKEGK